MMRSAAFVEHHAAGDDRPAAKGASAELDAIGVAKAHLHLVRFQAEGISDDLREGDLMALTVRMGADGHGDAAGRVEADVGAFGQRAGDRTGGNLDGIGDTDAGEPAARGCFLAPLRKPGPIAERQRRIHVALELTGIVGEQKAGRVGHLIRRNQVLPPQFDGVHAETPGGKVDDALDGVGRLRPPGAAIWGGWLRVGEGAGDAREDRRGAVDARQSAEIIGGRVQPVDRDVGADIRDSIDPQCEEAAVAI